MGTQTLAIDPKALEISQELFQPPGKHYPRSNLLTFNLLKTSTIFTLPKNSIF